MRIRKLRRFLGLEPLGFCPFKSIFYLFSLIMTFTITSIVGIVSKETGAASVGN